MGKTITRRTAMKLGCGAVLLGLTDIDNAYEVSNSTAPVTRKLTRAFADGKYILPTLPYSYKALEPHYQERPLEIHHTKHHAGYVRGLNQTLEALSAAREFTDYSAIKSLSRNLAFHGSGHVLHSLFWNSMVPGGTEPTGLLTEAMEKNFGSLDSAKQQFSAAAKKVEGSGWAVLAYEPVGDKLLILQTEKHQNLTFWGAIPLLVCDVWEHAYYLQYANNRSEWVDNFLKLANWNFAAQRYEQARK